MRRLILGIVLAMAWAATAGAVCPPGAIQVAVGQSIQAAVNAAPAGARFCLADGKHRGHEVVPKTGQQFYGASLNAWMMGSKRVSKWTKEGTLWFATGQTMTPSQTNINECAPGYPLCNISLAVFHGAMPLRMVGSKAAVTADAFFHDRAAGRIYIGRSPAGAAIEVTDKRRAFSGTAANVLIQDVTVIYYGSNLQEAAIHGANASNWTIKGVRVLRNRAVGIDLGTGTSLHDSIIRDNGEMGLAGGGTGLVVERNRILNNGRWAGLDPAWEGGGGKFTEVHGTFTTVNGALRGTGLTFCRNTVRGNGSVGVWADEGTKAGADNSGILICNNVIEDNDSAGISVEITKGKVMVVNNRLLRNGVTSGWFWGGCLQAYDSQGVEASGNTCDVAAEHGNGMMVISQGGRGVNACGNWFHDNVIILRGGGVTGVTGDNIPGFCGANANRLDRNKYFVAGPEELSELHWAWLDDERTWQQFLNVSGQEKGGTISTTLPPQ